MRTLAQPQAARQASSAPHPRSGPSRSAQPPERATGTDAAVDGASSQVRESPRPRHDFGRIAIRSGTALPIQAKLTVSTPGDSLEQEADRVADAVVAGRPGSPGGRISRGVQPRLYRVQARPEDLVDSMPPRAAAGAEGAGASEEVQRSAEGGAPAVTPAFERSLQQARGGGEALPASTRRFMEGRFGWDFSSVRVHSDARSHALARDVSARAFTLADDIFFAPSQYRPESPEGRHLLAHELTHVVQQSEGRVSRRIQRNTSCSSYPGYNAGAPLTSYNCAGLALRTYTPIAPPSAVYSAIAANFIAPRNPSGSTCGPGEVKFWMWEYDMSFEDDLGTPVYPAQPDFHIVAGRADPATGADPTDVYSKNGKRPVYGPGTGPGFRPPARERATLNAPSETPLDAPNGRPLMKVRSNMSTDVTCAGCHP